MLGESFRQHVLSEQVPILEDEVTKISHEDIWQILLASGNSLETETLVYAAGAIPRQLGIPGEQQYQGKGISYCAYCDGSLYKGKDVAVVGGGDSALDDAEHGKIAAEICRKDELLSYFEHVDPAIKEYLDEMLYATLSEYMDLSEAFAYLKRIMDSVVTELFDRYEWLNFYFLKEDHLL